MALASIACIALLTAMPGEDGYLDGRAAEEAGRYGRAEKAYLECAQLDGPLAPYARMRAAVCRSFAKDGADTALETLRALAFEGPDGPWARMGRLELARVLVRELRHEEAETVFEKGLDIATDLWWLDPYRWAAAENRLEIPRLRKEGFVFFRQTVEEAGFRQIRLDAAKILARSPEADDRIAAALGMIRSRAHEEAQEVAATLAKSVSEDPVSGVGRRELAAKLLVASGKEQQGRGDLLEMVKEAPESDWAAPALLYVVRSLVRDDLFEETQSLCARLDDAYADSPEAGEARWRLAEGLDANKQPAAAIRAFRLLAERHPGHARAAAALLQAGHLLREGGNSADAVAAYSRVENRSPRSGLGPEAAYWTGRLLAKVDEKGAAERYRAAAKNGVGLYYAHRAQQRLARLEADGKSEAVSLNLKVDGKTSFVAPIPVADPAPGNNVEKLVKGERFQRLRFFGRHGLEEAEWEALHLAESLEGNRNEDMLYTALGEAGTAYSAMQMVGAKEWGRDAQGVQTAQRLRVRFPRAYWPYVSGLGAETGLDPYLILAVARRESTYRPALTSWAGARGVMQLMPRTARWLVDTDAHLDRGLVSQLEDPHVSLRLGASYLKRMMDRSGGNVIFALASYNGGPGNCDKWRKEFPGTDMDAFIENIPFDETRDYVKHVLGYYAAYHSLYPPAPAPAATDR